MTQLFINGREVALPAGFSATLTEENPYFTSAGQYSDEIELDLKGVNAQIFGNIGRRDTTFSNTKYSARLVVNNHIVVDGEAAVTGIDADKVKVQILGNNSAVNYLVQLEEQYIDELNLGYACEGLKLKTAGNRGVDYRHLEFSRHTYKRGDETSGTIDWHEYTDDDPKLLYDYSYGMAFNDLAFQLFGPPHLTYCVFCPAVPINSMQVPGGYNRSDGDQLFSTDSDTRVNAFIHSVDTDLNWIADRNDLEFQRVRGFGLNDTINNNVILPQPYLVHVIERIIEEIGYTMVTSDLRTDWLRDLYIVNTTYTLKIEKMLPHWSVTKWLTEVERLLGVIFWFDSKTKTCTVRKRANSFSESVLLDVDDSYTTEVDDEQTTDISNANVTTDQNGDKLHQFDETLLEHTNIIKFQSYAALSTFLLAGQSYTDGTPVEACVAIDLSTGDDTHAKRYILKDGKVVQVNQMGNLIRSAEGEEIELGIQPAPMVAVEAYTVVVSNGTMTIRETDNPNLMRAACAQSFPLRKAWINAAKYIDGTESFEDNTVDKLYVALYHDYSDAGTPEYISRAYYDKDSALSPLLVEEFFGNTYQTDDLTGINFQPKQWTCQLFGATGLSTLEQNWTANSIDTTKKYSMTAYVDSDIDVRKVLIVDGKRFVIESAKYIIDVNGIGRKVELIGYKITG